MGLRTDDPDSRPAWLHTHLGGNGDYYFNITEVRDQLDNEGNIHPVAVTNTLRVTTSGGRTPIRIKELIVELHRELEKEKMCDYPSDEDIKDAIKRKT